MDLLDLDLAEWWIDIVMERIEELNAPKTDLDDDDDPKSLDGSGTTPTPALAAVEKS